jgi:hypothetical protein
LRRHGPKKLNLFEQHYVIFPLFRGSLQIMENYIVTDKDIVKYDVLSQLIDKKINGRQASALLGYTEVHVSRLKQKTLIHGFKGLLRKRREPSHKTPVSLKTNICNLYRDIYFDFNVVHFTEKLRDIHNISLSRETVRQILINDNILKPKKRKKVYRRRRRMPKIGMLIQHDSSEHKWLPNIDEDWYLILSIDDASNTAYFAELFPCDDVFNNMKAFKTIIQNNGLPTAFYTDRASHFKTTRLGGLHVETSAEQNDTNIQMALRDLNVNLILANSPQAKGRVERCFRVFQDRFIKEMRINGISDYEQANLFLKNQFLPFYNNRFSFTDGISSDFRPLPPATNLDLIFSKRFTRKVKLDNTIHFFGSIIQLPPSKINNSLAKCLVDLRLNEDNTIYVLYNNEIVHHAALPDDSSYSSQLNTISNLLNQRKYVSSPV